MPEHDRYVPKHRQPAARRAPRTALRTALVLSSLAVAGTATAVAGGAVALSPSDAGTGALDASPSLAGADLGAARKDPRYVAAAEEAAGEAAARVQAPSPASATPSSPSSPSSAAATRAPASSLPAQTTSVSRSDRRGVADPVKEQALSTEADDNAMTRSEDISDEDPRTIARALLAAEGSESQFGCLDSLWTRESGWSTTADNPSSSAYGIPQALPGSKMSSFGADWATNPVTQIRWGLDYIEDRYGSPCGAWSHSQGYGWY